MPTDRRWRNPLWMRVIESWESDFCSQAAMRIYHGEHDNRPHSDLMCAPQRCLRFQLRSRPGFPLCLPLRPPPMPTECLHSRRAGASPGGVDVRPGDLLDDTESATRVQALSVRCKRSRHEACRAAVDGHAEFLRICRALP